MSKKIVDKNSITVTTTKPTFVQLAADTEAGRIWEEIKNRSIEMFALPDQKVHQYCEPVLIEPSKLYLKARTTSVLPALELSCGKQYKVELVDRFLTVSRIELPAYSE